MVSQAKIFLSYARSDDEPFVKKLYKYLTEAGYDVWWDREKMPDRGLTFLREIREAIEAADRLILVWGKAAATTSKYVTAEWQYALQICKPVKPILRIGNYADFPDTLKNFDIPDFRKDEEFDDRLAYILRQFNDPVRPLGKLIGVPSLPDHYLPRLDIIQAVRSQLLIEDNKPLVVTSPARKAGLHGMGGIGKSVLASAVTRHCDIRRSYPDGIYWITLGQNPNLTQRQSQLARELGSPGQIFHDAQDGKAHITGLLSEKKILLVLDDIWQTDHAQAFDVVGAGSSLLVTTRDSSLITALGANEHQLNTLSPGDALTLIATWLLEPDETPEYDELKRITHVKENLPTIVSDVARECGYLPLALAICAAWVRDRMDWNFLFARLKEAKLDFLDHPHGSVMASLQVSVDALEKENPNHAKHYRELAVFPEDVEVPENALFTLWLHTNGLKPNTAEKLFLSLERKALIRVVGERPQRRISLHDLQHDYLRRVTETKLQAIHSAIIEAYCQKCDGNWAKGTNDGYFFEHLAYHLCESKRSHELIELIDNTSWMDTQVSRSGVYASFLNDVDVIWKSVSRTGFEELHYSKHITTLGIQIRSLLLFSSVASFSNEIPPLLPALLVQDEIWSPLQGVEYSSRVPDINRRIEARLALLLTDNCKSKIVIWNAEIINQIVDYILTDFEIIKASNERLQGQLLIKVIPFLESEQISRVLNLATSFDNKIWRARLLANILSRITDSQQQIDVLKQLIVLCGELSYSEHDDDFQYVPYLYQEIARNLLIDALSPAWQKIRKELQAEVHQIEERYQNISEEEPKQINNKGRREFANRFDKEIKLLRFFDYLAWYIPVDKANIFVDLLYDLSRFEPLPFIATKIARLAPKLTDDTALNLAQNLSDRFETASSDITASGSLARKIHWYDGTTSGCGIAFIALAYGRDDPSVKQQILEITYSYMKKYGDEESPITGDDLQILHKWVSGQHTDSEMADQVRNGQFLSNFWDNTKLARNSCELISYLGHETILTLFEKCIEQTNYTYLHIGASPYIIPSIAKKLPNNKLDMIYQIGEGRGESFASLGYFIAAIQNVERMSKSTLDETIKWSLNYFDMYGFDDVYRDLLIKLAPYLQTVSREKFQRKQNYVAIAAESGLLATTIIQDAISTRQSRYSDKIDDNQRLFRLVRFLPIEERLPYLKHLEEQLFTINDAHQTAIFLSKLADLIPRWKPTRGKRFSRLANNKKNDLLLRQDIEEKGFFQTVTGIVLGEPSYRPFVVSFLLLPMAQIKHISSLVKLLRLMFYVSDVQAAIQKHRQLSAQHYEERMQLYDVPSSIITLMEFVNRFAKLLASSSLIWRVLIGIALAINVVWLLLMVSLSILIMVFLWPIGLILGFLYISISSLVFLFQNKTNNDDKNVQSDEIWQQIKQKINDINLSSDSKDRENLFDEINTLLGDMTWVHDSSDYIRYTKLTREIWIDLNPEFLDDAITVLHGRSEYSFAESNAYVRAFIPPIAILRKDLLPEVEKRIEEPYQQLKAIQYANLALCLSGEDQIQAMHKSVGSFEIAEFPETMIPHILSRFVDNAPIETYPKILDWIQDYPSSNPLTKIAPHISHDDKMLEQAFQIAKKINVSVADFICVLAPELDSEWLFKCLVFILERKIHEEQEKSYPVLVERWITLPIQEAYQVWVEFLPYLKPYSRGYTVAQLSELIDVIIYLGGSSAVNQVAEDVTDICSWWEQSLPFDYSEKKTWRVLI